MNDNQNIIYPSTLDALIQVIDDIHGGYPDLRESTQMFYAKRIADLLGLKIKKSWVEPVEVSKESD